MVSITENVVTEVADNWPAFVYIALTIGFSVFFLRERRAETQLLKRIGACLNERIDRLEYMLAHSRNISSPAESQQCPTPISDSRTHQRM
jgi:hypothetical protein